MLGRLKVVILKSYYLVFAAGQKLTCFLSEVVA